MPLAIAVHPDDNAATLIDPVSPSEEAEVLLGSTRSLLRASAPIPSGHKIALRDIPQGHPVIKFGQRIGCATVPIRAGDHVHVHNVAGFASGR
ncbi:MAG: D-galactarate dehydratase [Candidatus Latescibacteria bacterium]|nr:D-galactarate dehydratase [Candidatus Latescibacterota bacterium]